LASSPSGGVVGGHHDVAGPRREAGEALLRVERHGPLRHEALLRRLLRHAHAAADLGPRRARPAGLVDEVPDEVVGDVAEVLGRDHRVGELVQRVLVDAADRIDQVVEADGRGRQIGHPSTIC
jgi:hypothetical protein